MSDLYKSLIKSKLLEVKSDYLNGNKDSFLLKSYPKFSDAFELEEYLQKSTKINTFDLYIRELCRKDKDNIDLILLLRCRVSHAIKVNIYSMFRSIRNKDNQTLKALFNEVLEDDGERFLKFKESRSFKKYFKNSSKNEESSRKSKNYKYVKKPFNLKIIEKLYEISNDAAKDNPKIEKGRIHPFCANIILSYGSNKRTNASISTWTKYMVERNKGIKIITRRIGYRSMTPYALVADNSESQVIKAWQKFGVIELEAFDISLKKYNKIKREKIILEIVKDIYNLYSYHYRISKDQYRETHKRDVGWRPDRVFWEKVSPKRSLLNTNIKSVDTEKIFNCIEQSLRKRSGDQFQEIPDDGNLENQPDKELDDLKENDELNIFIKELVLKEAYRQTEFVIKEDRKNWEENKTESKKWKLFSQEREFNEIQEMTGIGKPSLSKKFKFEIIAGKTAQYVIKNLKEIYNCDQNNMKTFIEEFNQKNNLKIVLDEELINVFKRYLASSNSKKSIFDNQERFDTILETITRFVNPRKGIKKILSEIVREILKNKK